MDHKIDSLKKRYFFKLFSNIFTQGASVAIQALVARGLGPKSYGDFNLLSNFFTQVLNFFDMGTSTAFYTKLSQKMREAQIVVFYRYYALIVSFFVVAFIAIAHLSSFYGMLWPAQEIRYVYLGAIFGILSWLISILNKMTDAYRLTVQPEVARAAQKVFGLALIAVIFYYRQLDLGNYFYYQYIILLMLGLSFMYVIKRNLKAKSYGWHIPIATAKEYSKEFYDFSHPLFTAVAFGFIVSIVDRWLLQVYGGSIQQGFFGLSYQIGLFCILFTSAMTPLFIREFSIAYGNKDMKEMRNLFHTHLPLLFSITAFIACFMVTEAGRVVHIIGGDKYASAVTAVTIMSLYPIHQTYGQLSGSLIFAAGQTRLYRNIEIIFSVLGLGLSYLLLAPHNVGGLDFGAMGLAVKMVLLQFVYVNVLLFFNTRLLDYSFRKYFMHQIICVAVLLLSGVTARFLTDGVLHLKDNLVLGFISSGMVYVVMVVLIGRLRPGIFGITPEVMTAIITGMDNIKKRR